eukprot:1925145-Rhodomonas_salina.2
MCVHVQIPVSHKALWSHGVSWSSATLTSSIPRCCARPSKLMLMIQATQDTCLISDRTSIPSSLRVQKPQSWLQSSHFIRNNAF